MANKMNMENANPVNTTTTMPVPAKQTDASKPKMLPPFKVILHNDPKNTFDHVIRTIVQLTPLDEKAAVERSVEAHKTGCSLLLVTHQERAELYLEQFQSASLTVTIEPAD